MSHTPQEHMQIEIETLGLWASIELLWQSAGADMPQARTDIDPKALGFLESRGLVQAWYGAPDKIVPSDLGYEYFQLGPVAGYQGEPRFAFESRLEYV